jgi:hypothetical protein
MGLVPAAQIMNMPMIVGAHPPEEVQFALDTASALVEAYCERRFARVLGDQVSVDPHRGNGGKGMTVLPDPPVTNVSNVLAQMHIGQGLEWIQLTEYQWAEDGLLYDVSPYYGYNGAQGEDFWSGGPSGQLEGGSEWPWLPRSLQVTYDHGFVLPGTVGDAEGEPLPDAVVLAIVKAASQILINPADIASYSAGIISFNFHSLVGGNKGTGGGIIDEMLLAPYRLVHL